MKRSTLLCLIAVTLIFMQAFHASAQCTAGYTNTLNGASASFTNTCSGAITPFYSWNFGDNTYSNLANPNHSYLYNGTYIVCLQYNGDSLSQPNCSASFCDTIVITGASNPPCSAVFTAHNDSSQPVIVFNHYSQYNVQWNWDFGDGNTSTLQNPVHQYSANAAYSVCLTAVTTLGDTCSYCKTINSTPCVQLLNASFTNSSNPSNTVSFTSSTSGSANPYYDWFFGDGGWSSQQHPVHTYPFNGIYTVTLTYSDSANGCHKTFSDTVKVINSGNPPCNLTFNNSGDSLQNSTVNFYSNGTVQGTQWLWNFGDGTTSTQTSWVSHAYSYSGTYTVCLQVIRLSLGDTCTFCDTVNVGILNNYLSGSVFSDANSNCVKNAGDLPLANWMIKAHNSVSQTDYYGVSANNGDFSLYVPTGNYSLSLLPLNSYWNPVCPVSPYSFSVSNYDTVLNLNYGLQPVISCADLAIELGSTNHRRCLTNNYMVVKGANNGTVAKSNILLRVDFDPRVIPLNSTLPWDSISGTKYFWKLGTLTAGQSVSFTVQDSVSCNAQWGDTLHSHAFISPVTADCNTNNNVIEDYKMITGSYDPNEKKVITTSNKVAIFQGTILATDTLEYELGFQNTGNDTAFTVTIFDTLDAALDVSSVVGGISTHPYTLQFMGSNVLKFKFSNILLPDSNVNEPKSHGFVKFRILQKPNNPLGTVIKNWVGIVFDYNVPVITDTVVLTVGTHISVNDIQGKSNQVIVYPSPTNGTFILESGSKYAYAEVLNILGEKIISARTDTGKLRIDISDHADGIYLIRVKTENGIRTGKIVKQ